jgi:hypothetical protein
VCDTFRLATVKRCPVAKTLQLNAMDMWNNIFQCIEGMFQKSGAFACAE